VIPEGSRGQGFKDSSELLKNYKDLKVWQKSYELCFKIYRITTKFPKEERYGLTSQLRRSVVSIPSNIAEVYGRKTTADYIRMLKALIKSLENKPLNPRPLGPLDPLLQLNWRITMNRKAF